MAIEGKGGSVTDVLQKLLVRPLQRRQGKKDLDFSSRLRFLSNICHLRSPIVYYVSCQD